MKFFFLKEHGLYKIFKTLEKVPNKKTIHIYIDPEHAFFQNDRWSQQIKEIFERKQIIGLFIAKTTKAKNFFERNQLQYIFQEKHPILKALHAIKLFLFDIKRFHLHAIEKKNYIFFMVFGIELLFVGIIIFFLYTLIVPNAVIYVTPTYQIEQVTYNFRYYPVEDETFAQFSRQLTIPFHQGYMDYSYTLTTSASNIRNIQNPSEGKIRIFNPTDQELSLVANTRFITNDGLFFQTPEAFVLPAAQGDQIGEVSIQVKAMEYDQENVSIGSRGNILSGTQLWIRNLTRSFFTKEIYAVAQDNFQGGSASMTGFLTEEDADILSGKLVQHIERNLANILRTNFNDTQTFFLNFNELLRYEIGDIKIDDYKEQDQPILRGNIRVRIHFPYIKRADFESAIMTYTKERLADNISIIGMDKNSLILHNDIRRSDNVLIIPTNINIIQGYDFTVDTNQITESIKDRIIGLSADRAREIILSYPEISTARISIRPPRYTTIPRLKSRIRLRIDSPN